MTHAHTTPIHHPITGQHQADWYSIHPHSEEVAQALSASISRVVPLKFDSPAGAEAGVHRPDLAQSKPVPNTGWKGWDFLNAELGFVKAFIK